MSSPLSAFAASAELRAVTDSVEEYAIFLIDPAGIVTTWNRGARRLKGYEPSQIVGRSFTLFYTEEDRAAGLPQRLLGEAERSGRTESEGWRVRRDGSRFWADAVLSALRDEHGALSGYVKVTRDLTERRRDEERVRESEQRLRLLVDSVKDYAIFMLDAKGHVATWNTGAQRTKGYAAHEIIGRHFSAFYPPEKIAEGKTEKLLQAAAADGRVEDEGFRVRKDGSRFWADVVISRIDDAQGRLVGFTKVTRDLTDRRRVEEALRHSEERMRLMIQSVKDYAIFMLDPSGRVTTWNAGAERLKGYRESEIIGEHFSRFYTPEDIDERKPERELEIASSIGRFEDEGIRVRKDGSHFWANVVLTPIRNGTGELIGFTKVTRDMTDRRRVANAMADRAHQQTAVAELGLFALQTSDMAALLSHATQSARSVLRTDAVRIASGSSADGLFAPVPIYGGHQSAPPYGFVGFTEPRSPDAAEASFMQAVANVIAAALSRKDMEEQLRTAERDAMEERARTAQAREALLERDEFISVAAHELRTPLTALQLKLQNLERGMRGSDRKEATRIEAAVRQTERMAKLVDRLLDVSRIAQGRLEMVREHFDLATLVRQVADDFREPAAHARAPLEIDVPAAINGSWDRLRIEQVLVNVLSNAVKYGAGHPIGLKVSDSPEHVRIEVSDGGIGISGEDLDRIFDRFERAASIRNYGGMGLGLYITKHIVEGHGGTVSVSSKLGKGSVFVIELPRLATTSAAAPGRSRARA